jgi:hypothetical protein
MGSGGKHHCQFQVELLQIYNHMSQLIGVYPTALATHYAFAGKPFSPAMN